MRNPRPVVFFMDDVDQKAQRKIGALIGGAYPGYNSKRDRGVMYLVWKRDDTYEFRRFAFRQKWPVAAGDAESLATLILQDVKDK